MRFCCRKEDRREENGVDSITLRGEESGSNFPKKINGIPAAGKKMGLLGKGGRSKIF